MGADAILTDSEFSRCEILRVYEVPPEKVHTIYPGVDRANFCRVEDPQSLREFRARQNLPADFLLLVGGIHPRRNLGTIITALHQVKSANTNLRALELIVIGRALELPANWSQPDVRYLGYIPDRDLPPGT